MKILISMEKPRLSSKIEEVEYHGVKFKVKREFYVSNELGEYTTTEQDQKWWDDMKRQYYEYLGKVISDAKYLDGKEDYQRIYFDDPCYVVQIQGNWLYNSVERDTYKEYQEYVDEVREFAVEH